MDKRVYGVLGIQSKMANWNADFSGYPKSISTGEVFGSDKAFKYPMKKLWEQQGKKVLYIKSLKTTKDDKKQTVTVTPKSLKERYEQLFEVEDLKKEKDATKVLSNLFKAIDVKNFGATFAEEGTNFSIIGAVQIGQGFNKYEGHDPQEQQILSPFRDSSKEKQQETKGEEVKEAKNSTLGTKIVSNEAHYFYPFVINSKVYDAYTEMGVTEGYTEEDYKAFKEAALVGATAFNSNSKLGCENEFALFIETKEDVYLPELSEYISFRKEEDKNVISLGFIPLIGAMREVIDKIEVYYNPLTTRIENGLENAKYYNLFTREEI